MAVMRSLLSHLAGFLLLLASTVGGNAFCLAFSPSAQSAAATMSTSTTNAATRNAANAAATLTPTPTCQQSQQAARSTTRSTSALRMGLFDGLKRFTDRAAASHILLSFAPDAESRLEEMKTDIDDSPIKFAEFAQLYSECPSSSSGGSLGEFGRGAMVKEFDEVVFHDELNVVHGPIETKFGYHLIYITQRSD
uniref:Peptidyl-prolyl cis-trans isomerase n=1 Tax=Minutocellus polymorphus TaxID=265543 RepID=A0A7S0ARD5_9STRA|mmetsp:Transcript_19714/g.32618  ORF Transcript_19714/g.32618 Transcript_19714/m.32618 type:complete len:194 (+) Transcript_19714:31-612(+)